MKPTDLKTYNMPIPISKLIEKSKKGVLSNYETGKDFDSSVIEMVLLGVFPNNILMYHNNNASEWIVHYGFNVIDNILKFVEGGEKLNGLKFFPNLEGKTYEEIPPIYYNKLNDTILNITFISPSTPIDVRDTTIELYNKIS